MALFKPLAGSASDLVNKPLQEGCVYFCDNGNVFFDIKNSEGILERKQINGDDLVYLVNQLNNKYDVSPYLDYVGSVPCTTKDKETGEVIEYVAVMSYNDVPETLMFRDENGNAQISDPIEEEDIVNKKYADTVSKKYLHRVSLDFTVANDQQDAWNGITYTINFQFQVYLSKGSPISSLEEFRQILYGGNGYYTGVAFLGGVISTPLLGATISTSRTENWFFGYVIEQGAARIISGVPNYTGITLFPPQAI